LTLAQVSPDVMEFVEQHLDRFVAPHPTAPSFTARNGEPLRPSSLWHYWDRARKATGITQYHFHDLRHYAATVLASSGAIVSEIQKRGRWKSTVMPLRYQHATRERDSYLADKTAPFVPLPIELNPIAPVARPNQIETRAFTPEDAVTRTTDDNSSGGETRTLNLAVNSRLLCH
jgi:hypothetical protein